MQILGTQIGEKTGYALITLAVVFMLFMLSILIIPMMIDTEALRKQAQNDLSNVFGQEVRIREAEASFFFRPTVTFQDISVRNHPNALSSHMLRAQSIMIDYGMFDFLSEEFYPHRMTFSNMIVDIEAIDQQHYNLHIASILSNMKQSGQVPNHIIVQNGSIKYSPYRSKNIYEIKDINISTDQAMDTVQMNADFLFNKDRFRLEGSTIHNAASDAVLDVNLDTKLFRGEEFISYNGTMHYTMQPSTDPQKDMQTQTKAEGAFTVSIDNARYWLELLHIAAQEEQLYSIMGNEQSLKGEVLVRYQSPALAFTTQNMLFNDQEANIKGTMVLTDKHKFQLDAEIAAIAISDDFADHYSVPQANRLFQRLLPKDMQGTLNLMVHQLDYADITTRDANISGTLLDGEFIINQSSLNMDGDTRMLLFGIIKRDINSNITLDGNIELIGKDVQAFMTALRLDEHKLLANHKGNFRAKSNLFISASKSTISELRFQAGKFSIEGALEYHPQQDIHYEASLKVKGGKLDSLAQYVNPTQTGGFIDQSYNTPKITLPWLDDMHNNYRLVLLFDQFTLFDMEGRKSRFVVQIQPNKMALSNVDFHVGHINFSGGIAIDQSGTIPMIDADFYLSHLNVNSLAGNNFKQHPVPRDNILSVWDDNPLNIDFLKGYGGRFRIEFGEVNHDSFDMYNVFINADSEEGVWTIEELAGDIWGGQISTKGMMDVTSIAAARLDFKLKNIFLHQMLKSTVMLDAIRGRMNINGRIDTAGVSMNNLIDNLSANIVLYGKDIVIRGFDMAGLIQALPSVRSNNEVANTVRVALIRGQTTFRSIEGAFHIAGGKLKTHGLKLRSKHAIGTMIGEANLISWMMNYAITFKLPSLAISDFPELTLYFQKSMDDPLLQANTRNLESFMTQRRFNR